MLCTARQELLARIPGAEFLTALPQGPLAGNVAAGFSPLPQPQEGKLHKAVRLARSLCSCPSLAANVLGNTWATIQAFAQVDGVDAIVDVSGFSYADVWGSAPARTTWAYVCSANKHGKPYIFLPQAWGPFTQRGVAHMTRRLLRSSPLVYARDQESLSHLTSLCGSRTEKIRLAPDIAFRFAGDAPEAGAKLLTDHGIATQGSPIVGIAPNMRIYERAKGEGENNEYVRLLVDLAGQIVQFGALVVLIPHEIGLRDDGQDDRFLCALIRKAASHMDKVHAMTDGYSAAAIKSVIARLDLLVASRFHSIVAALSSRVPPVVIGWSHKYIELMGSLGLEEYVLDYTKCQRRDLVAKLDKALANRDTLREQIAGRLAPIAQEVDSVFDTVAGVILSRTK